MTSTAARYAAANTLLALAVVDEDDPGLDPMATDLARHTSRGATAAQLHARLIEWRVVHPDPAWDPDGPDIAAAVHHALTDRPAQESRAA